MGINTKENRVSSNIPQFTNPTPNPPTYRTTRVTVLAFHDELHLLQIPVQIHILILSHVQISLNDTSLLQPSCIHVHVDTRRPRVKRSERLACSLMYIAPCADRTRRWKASQPNQAIDQPEEQFHWKIKFTVVGFAIQQEIEAERLGRTHPDKTLFRWLNRTPCHPILEETISSLAQ